MRPDYLAQWERRHAAIERLSRVDFSAYSAAAATLQSIDFSRLTAASDAAASLCQPDIAQLLESINMVSDLLKPCLTAADRIKPSVIQSLIGMSSAVGAAASRIDTYCIWDSLSAFRKLEEQMSAGARAPESFGTLGSAWSKTIDRIYADDLDVSPITEDELEETVESPEIQETLSALNASPVVGQDALDQIFTILEENKRELDEIKAQNEKLLADNKAMSEEIQSIKKDTRKKSLVLRFLVFVIVVIIQQLLSQAVDEIIVKPAREAVTSARQGIHMQLRDSDPELSKFIVKTCMMTAHPNVILRSTHHEGAAPSAYLPFGQVVQVVDRHKKWRLVNYINGAGYCGFGWTQNWKLVPL